MTFVSALALLRRRWRALVVGALVGLLAGGVALAVSPTRYVAEAQVYVSGLDGPPAPGADFYTNYVLIEQRLASYRELLSSDRVLGPVNAAMGGPDTVGSVAVGPSTQSSVFAVTVVDDDAARAATRASAVGDRFVEVLAEVERAPASGAAPVRGSVIERPVLGLPAGPGAGSLLLAGLVLGGIAAVGWVLLRGVQRASATGRSGDADRSSVTGREPSPSTPGDPTSGDGTMVENRSRSGRVATGRSLVGTDGGSAAPDLESTPDR